VAATSTTQIPTGEGWEGEWKEYTAGWYMNGDGPLRLGPSPSDLYLVPKSLFSDEDWNKIKGADPANFSSEQREIIFGGVALMMDKTPYGQRQKALAEIAADLIGSGGMIRAAARRLAAGAIPKAANARLQQTIKALFQSSDKLLGGTAGAVSAELQLGIRVGGRTHIMKAQERIRNLRRILRQEPLSNADRATANQLLRDLQSALKEKRIK
jgi:hypothetical protein